MKCRIDINGRKTWIDGNNAFATRPDNIEVVLTRDGVVLKTVTLSSDGDGRYRFPCNNIWKNQSEKYLYQVDETVTPPGYTKTIQGNNIVNTLDNIAVSGTKNWVDNDDAATARPATFTVRLLQNGVEIQSVVVTSPAAPINTVEYDFGQQPFADAAGAPYIYTVTEDAIPNYQPAINGLNITNTYTP